MVKYYGKKFLRKDAEGTLRWHMNDRIRQGNFEYYLDKIYKKSASYEEILIMTDILNDIYTEWKNEYDLGRSAGDFIEDTIDKHINYRNELMAPIRKRQIKLMVRERA